MLERLLGQVLAADRAEDLVHGPQRGRLRPVADAIQSLARQTRTAGDIAKVRSRPELGANVVDQVHAAYGTLLSHTALPLFPTQPATFVTMSPPPALTILADNLARVVAQWSAGQHRTRDSIRGFAVACGMTAETQIKALRRAMKGDTIQLDTLEMLAAHMGFEPWKLLHPKFDPAQPLEAGALTPSAARLAKVFDELPISQEKMTAFAVILEICERTARGESVGFLTHSAPVPAPATPALPGQPAPSPAPTAKPHRNR